jgi:hypothetical protein
MASPATRTTTTVEWRIQPAAVQGVSFPIARLVAYLFFSTSTPDPRTARETCWLDTGAPLSVVPFHVHHQRLVWQPVGGITTTWSGQPCDLGRIDFWLATHQPPFLRGPLSLLAKFARSDPPGQPVPVLLGLEFLLAHQAELNLPPPPQQGVIVLP